MKKYFSISTKSSLILRDVELLKQFKYISVAVSVNTLDEGFKNDMDNAKIYWSADTMESIIKSFSKDKDEQRSLSIIKKKLGL